MATSVVMGDTNYPEDHEPKRRSSSGRRKMKGSDSTTTSSSGQQKRNKQPQRGMGVEKLEKLRVEENWKKMAHNPAAPDPIPIPILGAPTVAAYLGFQYGQVDLFGFGKQFSANTNHHHLLKSYSGHCYACHKKKKFNGDCGFLGLNNIGEYQNVTRQENHLGLKFGTNMSPQGHAEIVAVHRKGSSSSAEGVMMEYEFFPSSCSSSKSDSEINNNNEDDQSVMMNFAETPSSMPGFNRSGSSCVDLSLKLSY